MHMYICQVLDFQLKYMKCKYGIKAKTHKNILENDKIGKSKQNRF